MRERSMIPKLNEVGKASTEKPVPNGKSALRKPAQHLDTHPDNMHLYPPDPKVMRRQRQAPLPVVETLLGEDPTRAQRGSTPGQTCTGSLHVPATPTLREPRTTQEEYP